MVIVDKQFQNGEETSIAGVTYSGDDGLRKGKCGLRINSVSMVDLDRSWNCILVTKNGTLFTGQVIVGQLAINSKFNYEGFSINMSTFCERKCPRHLFCHI